MWWHHLSVLCPCNQHGKLFPLFSIPFFHDTGCPFSISPNINAHSFLSTFVWADFSLWWFIDASFTSTFFIVSVYYFIGSRIRRNDWISGRYNRLHKHTSKNSGFFQIDRIRYILSSYLRVRLEKIERFAHHLLEKDAALEDESESVLSPAERNYAKE